MGNDINWDELGKNADEAIKNAAEKADEQLSLRISKLTTLNAEEINTLFPESSDLKKFEELMTIVKSAENRNDKIVKIIKNSENFAGIVLTLLSKLA